MLLVWIIPILGPICILVAFFCNFFAEVSKKRYRLVLFPYACDEADHPLTTGIFAEVLNVAAVLVAFTVYLKHRHSKEYFHETKHRRKGFLITSGFLPIFGYLIAVALSVAANFLANTTETIEVRTIALVIMCGASLVYMWGQAMYGFLVPVPLCPRMLAQCRMGIAFLATVFFGGTFAHVFESHFAANLQMTCTENQSVVFWISAISECCLTACICVFLMTTAVELYRTKLCAPKLCLQRTEQQPTAFLDNYRLEYLSTSNVNALPETAPDVIDPKVPGSPVSRGDAGYGGSHGFHEEEDAEDRGSRGYVVYTGQPFESSQKSDDQRRGRIQFSPEEEDDQGQPQEPDADYDTEEEEEMSKEVPAILSVIAANSYYPSDNGVMRRESILSNAQSPPPVQQKPRASAFSYIPDMPNPFNTLGQLRKVPQQQQQPSAVVVRNQEADEDED